VVSTNRRKFSNQFKAELVQKVFESGSTIAQVVKDLGLIVRRQELAYSQR
jgi:transposase-like protein